MKIQTKRKLTEATFLLPAFIVILIAVLWPLIYEFVLSFFDIKMTNILSIQDAGMNFFKLPKEYFIGIGNYTEIFKSGFFDSAGFYQIFGRTLGWTFINILFHVTGGVFFAVLLNRKLPGKAFFRVLLIIPWALPQYIAVLIWKGMFQYDYGAINKFLAVIGLDRVQWFSDPNNTFLACILTNIWLGIPFMMMIALGGLQSIPGELYEAADIDGANSIQQFAKITAPLLKPVMAPSIVLGTVWTFNMINVIFIMTDGSSNAETHILVTEVYREAFNFYRYGFSAAYSVVIFLILVIFSAIYLKVTKVTESEVKV